MKITDEETCAHCRQKFVNVTLYSLVTNRFDFKAKISDSISSAFLMCFHYIATKLENNNKLSEEESIHNVN